MTLITSIGWLVVLGFALFRSEPYALSLMNQIDGIANNLVATSHFGKHNITGFTENIIWVRDTLENGTQSLSINNDAMNLFYDRSHRAGSNGWNSRITALKRSVYDTYAWIMSSEKAWGFEKAKINWQEHVDLMANSLWSPGTEPPCANTCWAILDGTRYWYELCVDTRQPTSGSECSPALDPHDFKAAMLNLTSTHPVDTTFEAHGAVFTRTRFSA